MIDRPTVERILDAADIVDVVQDFVTLRKRGVNYVGLCPFHDDKTPSFYVSPSKGVCKCFACGKGGNVVNFIMEHEQVTYPEALRWLARKYNIEIKERELTDEERREQGDRESMLVVNEWARDYFANVLMNDIDGQAIGKQYFRSRGFRDDIMVKFQLGFSLAKRDAMASAALAQGFKEEYLLKTGLCYKRESGELVDRYAGRVIFPWLNVSGKVVAFGGRLLDARTKGVQQKYVNSSDSDIFHKDHELYGLYQAKRAIVKEDCVYMVEGYTDVISMHQCGIENVVANSGTALSRHQAKLLHRFTPNIVLLYDGDEAGLHAAMRGTDIMLAEGMNVRVLVLPDGDDPDSFARKHKAEEVRKYIGEHQVDFIEFKTRLLLNGVTDPIKRSEAISSIVRSVALIPNAITRDTYLHDCVGRLGVNERTLVNTLNGYISNEREQKAKEADRDLRREQGMQGSQPAPGEQPQGEQQTGQQGERPAVNLQLAEEHGAMVEKMLAEEILTHGDVVIYSDLETDDGQKMNLNVAQYIDYDMAQDGLQFANELYNRILAEAVEHSADEGFCAETFFLHHPDIDISTMAGHMALPTYTLSRSLAMRENTDTIRQKVAHLMMDWRLDITKRHLREIKMQLSMVQGDMAATMELMRQYKEAQELRDMLARRIGSDVI